MPLASALPGLLLANPMVPESAGLGVTGWAAVAGYAFVTWLCMRAFMVEKAGPPRPYRQALAALWRITKKHWPKLPTPARRAGLWVAIAVVIAILGINRLFDIEDFLLDTWRAEAVVEGSYDSRGAMQVGFVFAAGAMAATAGTGLLLIARGQLRDFRLVLAATIAVLTLAVVRAASLHDVDALMRTGVGGLNLGVFVELLGLGVIGYAVRQRLRRDGVGIWPRRRSSSDRDAPKQLTSDQSRRASGPKPTAKPRPSSKPQPAARPRAGGTPQRTSDPKITITQLD